MTTPVIDYTNRDYDTIRAALEASIRAKFPDTWKDFTESSVGITLMELVAYCFDVLSYMIDCYANESFISTAKDRESMILLGQLVGYDLRPATSASVTTAATLAEAQLYDVLIPAGTEVSSVGGVKFQTLEDWTIPATELTTDIDLIQGLTVVDEFTSDGTSFQEFQLSTSPFIDGSLTVLVDGFEWDGVDSLVYSDGSDQSYSLRTDVDDYAHVKFGDGTSGQIPSNGSTIQCSYRVGGGVAGNIPSGEIATTVAGILVGTAPEQTVDVTLYNNERGSGGEEQETIDHARFWIPKSVTTNGRAVTEQDFDTLANTFVDPVYGAPAFAKAQLHQKVPESNCLVGSTSIPLLDGSSICIKDMQYDTQYWVYAMDSEGKVVPAKAILPRLTKWTKELVRVYLDNGECVECTPDHLWMMRSGSYKEAKELKVNDSLMPFIVRSKKEDKAHKFVKDPDGREHKFYRRVAHRLVSRGLLFDSTSGEFVFCEKQPDQNIIHHLNFDGGDDSPSNLVWMTSADHRRFHKETSSKVMVQLWKEPWFQNKMKDVREQNIQNRRERRQSDPEYNSWLLERLQEGVKKARQTKQRKLKEDPVYAAEWSERSRKNGKKTMTILRADPEFIEKMRLIWSDTMKVTIKRLMGLPEYQELYKQLAKEAKVRLSNLWKSPEFRERQDKLREERNLSAEFQQTCRLGRYRVVAERCLKRQTVVTESIWELSREGGCYPKWATMLSNFGSFDNLVKTLGLNHKVSKIEFVNLDEPVPVYDITVEEYHNFAIGAGVFVHNCVDVYLWARDEQGNITEPSESLKSAVLDYFNNNDSGAVRIITVDVDVLDGNIVYIDLDVEVQPDGLLSDSETLSNCLTSLEDLFDSASNQPGTAVRMSKLYSALQATNGVDHSLIRQVAASYKTTETIDTSDGATTQFDFTTQYEIRPGTIIITAGDYSISDDGEGGLAGDVDPTAANTVDYETGVLNFTLVGTVAIGTAITILYRYPLEYLRSETDIATTNGVTTTYKGYLTYAPLVPSTVSLTDGTQTVSDDGNGRFTGDINTANTTSINYETGAYEFTFENAPSGDSEIAASYTQLLKIVSGDIPIEKNQLAIEGIFNIGLLDS